MDTFDHSLDSQLTFVKKDWTDEYLRSMASLSLALSPEQVRSNCDQVAADAITSFDRFEKSMGSVFEGTLAARRLSSARKEAVNMGVDGTKAKLSQLDEQVSLYNRALLNKLVQPILDKVRAVFSHPRQN